MQDRNTSDHMCHCLLPEEWRPLRTPPRLQCSYSGWKLCRKQRAASQNSEAETPHPLSSWLLSLGDFVTRRGLWLYRVIGACNHRVLIPDSSSMLARVSKMSCNVFTQLPITEKHPCQAEFVIELIMSGHLDYLFEMQINWTHGVNHTFLGFLVPNAGKSQFLSSWAKSNIIIYFWIRKYCKISVQQTGSTLLSKNLKITNVSQRNTLFFVFGKICNINAIYNIFPDGMSKPSPQNSSQADMLTSVKLAWLWLTPHCPMSIFPLFVLFCQVSCHVSTQESL